jgi:non-canonical poly(A) RNA polymerase PAPD5/7
MLGDTAIRATYRDIDELSDDDEVDMDISDNGDSDTDAADRPTKRARTDRSATVAQQDMPKWSNPDPYTALPPPETTRKKDVVQLIRKARVEAEAPKPAVASEAADFISCDFSDDDTSSQVHGNHTGETLRPDAGTDSHYPPLGPRDTLSSLPPKPPAPAYQQGHQLSGKAQSVQSLPLNPTRRSNKDVAPVDLHPTTSLGNRKRTIDDEIKLPVKPPHATLKKVNRMPSGGSITLLWRPTEGEEPCPWVSTDHSGVSNMGIRLHLEIRDFYGYVEPRDFEKKIRQELVSRLDQLVRKRWQDARVLPFGSFMSGLYLPTADMDIAICSKAFIERGSAVYDKKKSLYNMRAHLEKYKVHYGGPIEAITKAKVPLLKYTDNHTGLKVDISFEKMDGYNAVNTFRKWREQYPAMPPLVAVIKHFLLMRALNEPVNGGIGGFSVICMVVHLLQMMPEVQSRSMGDEQLGYLFMEFLDYYGNKFNYELVAIRMDPPGTVNKSKASTLVYRNLDRLSIIDPNNPENDISGGSSNYSKVKSCFAEAYDTLQKTMQRLASETSNAPSNDVKDTLLYPLLGGNYSYFRCQRDWLQKLDREGYPEYSIPAKDSYWDEPGFW